MGAGSIPFQPRTKSCCHACRGVLASWTAIFLSVQCFSRRPFPLLAANAPALRHWGPSWEEDRLSKTQRCSRAVETTRVEEQTESALNGQVKSNARLSPCAYKNYTPSNRTATRHVFREALLGTLERRGVLPPSESRAARDASPTVARNTVQQGRRSDNEPHPHPSRLTLLRREDIFSTEGCALLGGAAQETFAPSPCSHRTCLPCRRQPRPPQGRENRPPLRAFPLQEPP